MQRLKAPSTTLLLFLLVSASIAWSPPGGPLRRVADPLRDILTPERYAKDIHIHTMAMRVSDSNRRCFLSFATVAALTFASSTHPACAMNYKSRSQGYAIQKTDAGKSRAGKMYR
jgi:hypothetical protein